MVELFTGWASAGQKGKESAGPDGLERAHEIEADEAPAARVRVERARRIAERAHRGSVEPTGEPVIAHVSRVAQASPPSARPVAWLHEVFEYSSIEEEELLAGGLTEEELRALRLLSRPTESRSEASYLAHTDRIARSAGPGGDLARAVRRADLEDRMQHPRRRADGWHPPYQLALEHLLATGSPEAGRDSVSHRPRRPLGSPGSADRQSATKPSVTGPSA